MGITEDVATLKEKADKYDKIKETINSKLPLIQEHFDAINTILEDLNPTIKIRKNLEWGVNKKRVAEIYQRLLDGEEFTAKELAKMYGINQPNVYNGIIKRLKHMQHIKIRKNKDQTTTIYCFETTSKVRPNITLKEQVKQEPVGEWKDA